MRINLNLFYNFKLTNRTFQSIFLQICRRRSNLSPGWHRNGDEIIRASRTSIPEAASVVVGILCNTLVREIFTPEELC